MAHLEAAAYTVTPAYKTAKTDAADAISNHAFVFYIKVTQEAARRRRRSRNSGHCTRQAKTTQQVFGQGLTQQKHKNFDSSMQTYPSKKKMTVLKLTLGVLWGHR